MRGKWGGRRDRGVEGWWWRVRIGGRRWRTLLSGGLGGGGGDKFKQL